MFSYIFCLFKWFFGTAEHNCLGIDSQCKLAESLQVLHSHANLHSGEFDTISVEGACYMQQKFKSQRGADWQKAQENERGKKSYQKILFNSSVRGQL